MNTIARNILEMIDQMTPEQQMMIYDAVRDMVADPNQSPEEKEIKSKYSLDCLDCW